MTEQPPPLRPARRRGVVSAAVLHVRRAAWHLVGPVRRRYTTATSPSPGADAAPRRRRSALGIQTRRAAWRVVRPVRRDKAWTFATITGAVGITLLILLALSHLKVGSSQTVAGVSPSQADSLPDAPAWPAAQTALAQADEPGPQADPFAEFGADPEPVPEPEEVVIPHRAPEPEPVEPWETSSDPVVDVGPQEDPLWTADPTEAEFPPLGEPPAADGPQFVDEEPFDQFAESSEAITSDPPPLDPAAETLPVETPPLEIDLARLQLPAENDEEFVVAAEVSPEEILTHPLDVEEDAWSAPSRERLPRPVKSALYADRVSPETMRQIRDEVEADYEPETAAAAAQDVRVSVEKTAPHGAAVEAPYGYDIIVRNDGEATLERVIVEELLPPDHEVVDAAPNGVFEYGSLRWQLRDLRPGEQQTIHVELLPTAEGPAESLALVRPFVSVAADTRIVAETPGAADPAIEPEPPIEPEPQVEPQPPLEPEPPLASGIIELTVAAPESVRAGATCLLRFTVSNPGAVPVTGVVLRNDLPRGLEHSVGRKLEHEVGDLAPGESRVVKLAVRAEAGPAGLNRPESVTLTNHAEVIADGGLSHVVGTPVTVYAPGLQLRRWGYREAALEEDVTYENVVTNLGDETAIDVEVVEDVPPGVEVVRVGAEGRFDPVTHTVRWQLERLEPAETVRLDVILRPLRPGVLTTTVRAGARNAFADPIRARVQVQSGVADSGLPASRGEN